MSTPFIRKIHDMKTLSTPRVFPSSLEALAFDNRFIRELPADPQSENRRRQVPGACYSRVLPTPVAQPQLVAWSPEMAETLGIAAEDCETEMFAQVFAGNRLLPGMEPYASCYGGHQFGNWAGSLGTAAPLTLGRSSTDAVSDGLCSSRGPVRRRTRAGGTALRCCARR